MTIKQLQKTRNSKKLFKKGNLTDLGAQLLRLQKLLYLHLISRLRELLHEDSRVKLETYMITWREDEDKRKKQVKDIAKPT